ncbi:MAG: hypothetical protein AB7Q17_14755 [Phycisphaerae bacterium]
MTASVVDKPTSTANASRGSGLRELAAQRAAGRALDPRDPGAVRQAAGQMLADLFFKPLLAEMRKLPFGKEFGGGGRTEEIFGEQLDQQIADRVAVADRGGIAKRLIARLEGAASAKRAALAEQVDGALRSAARLAEGTNE